MSEENVNLPAPAMSPEAPCSAKTAQERRDSLWNEGWRPFEVGVLFISKSGEEIAAVLHDGTYFRGIKQNSQAQRPARKTDDG